MEELSPDDLALIKASIPVLRLHGIALAQRIHERLSAIPGAEALFAELPARREILVLALIDCARNIDRLAQHSEALRSRVPPEVRRRFRPEHAPALAHVFRNAMQDVLVMGDADPVLAAWQRAFWQLARMLGGPEVSALASSCRLG